MLNRSLALRGPCQDPLLDAWVAQIQVGREGDMVCGCVRIVQAPAPQHTKNLSEAVTVCRICRVGSSTDLRTVPLDAVLVTKNHARSYSWRNGVAPGLGN